MNTHQKEKGKEKQKEALFTDKDLSIQKGILEGTTVLKLNKVSFTHVTLEGNAGEIPAFLIEHPVEGTYISLVHIRKNKHAIEYKIGASSIHCKKGYIFLLKKVRMHKNTVDMFWTLNKINKI